MTSLDGPRKAYEFLRQHSISEQPFSVADLAAATGWAETTVNTYKSKQYRDFLDVSSPDEIRVRPEFERLTLQRFLELATQRRQVFADYERVKYDGVVTYEFLLPLTREDQLRAALDDLFFTDTIKHRLREIGRETVETWITANAGESDEDYLSRVSELVGEKFGGYSISHVNGRFRAGNLKDRAAAGKMLELNERYLVDETTAVVRFIIPIGSTRETVDDGFADTELEVGFPPPAVLLEVQLIHRLFFHLFVEAVARMVLGEDEIWLVEEFGPFRRLYVWERKEST